MNFSSVSFKDGITNALSTCGDCHWLLADFDEGVWAYNHVCASLGVPNGKICVTHLAEMLLMFCD